MLKAGRSLRSTRRGVSTTKQTSLLSRVLSKSCDATESLRNFEMWKRKCVEYYLYCATYWKPMSRSFGFLNKCLESVQTIDFNTTKQSFMLLTSYSAMSSVLNWWNQIINPYLWKFTFPQIQCESKAAPPQVVMIHKNFVVTMRRRNDSFNMILWHPSNAIQFIEYKCW